MSPEDASTPLDELYERPMRWLLNTNHMVKMLTMSLEEMNAGLWTELEFTDARTRQACANLDTLDLVGETTRFDQFCEALTNRTTISVPSRPRANTTEPEPASAELVARIEHDNAADLELYEYASRRWV